MFFLDIKKVWCDNPFVEGTKDNFIELFRCPQGRIGKPVKVRCDPVTVSRNQPRKTTGNKPGRGGR